MANYASRPLKYYSHISSGFGDRSGRPSSHQGADWPAPMWTKIRSIMSGRVIDKGYNAVYGHYVKLRTRKGHEWLVGHMAKATTLKVGAWRFMFWSIGYVGMSGAATGPHVHISIWQKQPNGSLKLVDPVKFIRTH